MDSAQFADLLLVERFQRQIERSDCSKSENLASDESKTIRKGDGPVKRCATTIIYSLLGMSLLLVGVSVMSGARRESFDSNTKSQIQVQVSDLQQDELNFARDVKRLRRDLRNAVSSIVVAKERNLVRQDWLIIVSDRCQPGQTAPESEQDSDLAGVIGDSFARPAELWFNDLKPASRG